MDSAQRKGIHFDLDTEALKVHYPRGDWHRAYSDVPELYDIFHVFGREAQRLSEKEL